MASATRVTKVYVESVEFDGAARTRVSKLFLEILIGSGLTDPHVAGGAIVARGGRRLARRPKEDPPGKAKGHDKPRDPPGGGGAPPIPPLAPPTDTLSTLDREPPQARYLGAARSPWRQIGG